MADMGRELNPLTESQGLQLQIQTIQFTPAKVEFNADQIASVLNLQLLKYKGLTFTEDTESEAKKVIAELRKGKALLETYRKTTKAELTAPVSEFEQQIKELANKFDAVINPLTEQTNQFEKDRIEKKRTVIKKIIDDLVLKFQLHRSFCKAVEAEVAQANREASESRLFNLIGVKKGATEEPIESLIPDFTQAEVRPGNITLKIYRVSGTAEEHEQLEAFLSDRIYDWSV